MCSVLRKTKLANLSLFSWNVFILIYFCLFKRSLKFSLKESSSKQSQRRIEWHAEKQSKNGILWKYIKYHKIFNKETPKKCYYYNGLRE